MCALYRHAAGILRKHQTQIACGFFQRRCRVRQGGKILCRGQRLAQAIARQFQNLAGAQRIAEKQAGCFRQLVRLVENHGIAGRQQFRQPFVAQHHIGKKQVMIDHDHICGLSPAARFQHKAVLVIGAFLPQAVVARRSDERPDAGILRHRAQTAFIAVAAYLGVALDQRQVFDVLAIEEAPFVFCPFQMVVTDIIGAPLEHCHRHRHLKCRAHGWNVAVEKLVLQGLGAG